MKKYSQSSLFYKTLKLIKENQLVFDNDKVFVALSGGIDSVVLLDVLLMLRDELNISVSACHFNHKMRGEESDNDQKFVENICRDRGVEIFIDYAKGILESENEAREARYTFFQNILAGEASSSKIALAHNSNDVTETTLMRLSRGAGLNGAKSIPIKRENFIRPLLHFSRKEIEQHAEDNHLKFITDSSNLDLKYTRNYFRHKIIPLFEKVNPNFINTMMQSIIVIDSEYDYLNQATEIAYIECVTSYTKTEVHINRKKWLTLHPAIQRSVIRKAIGEIVGLTDITSNHLNEVYEMLQKGVGKKYKILPFSLFCELVSGNINIYKKN